MGSIILIYGNEEYMKQFNLRKVLRDLPEKGSMNRNDIDGENADPEEIYAISQTLPFMEDKRLIVLRNTGFFNEQPADRVKDIFEELPDSTVLVFVENEADAKRSLYRFVQKNGQVIRCDSIEKKVKNRDYKGAESDRAMIRSWAAEYIRRGGCSIDKGTLEELLQLTGFDMLNLSTELEKLISYRYGDVIRSEDIEAISSKTVQDRVFDMLKERLAGNCVKAAAMFEEMLAVKIAPMLVLRLLQKQAEQIYVIKELSEKGTGLHEICERTDMQEWQVKKLKEQSAGMNRNDAYRLFEQSVCMEQKIKEGDMPEQIGIEILLSGR